MSLTIPITTSEVLPNILQSVIQNSILTYKTKENHININDIQKIRYNTENIKERILIILNLLNIYDKSNLVDADY